MKDCLEANRNLPGFSEECKEEMDAMIERWGGGRGGGGVRGGSGEPLWPPLLTPHADPLDVPFALCPFASAASFLQDVWHRTYLTAYILSPRCVASSLPYCLSPRTALMHVHREAGSNMPLSQCSALRRVRDFKLDFRLRTACEKDIFDTCAFYGVSGTGRGREKNGEAGSINFFPLKPSFLSTLFPSSPSASALHLNPPRVAL